MKKRGKYVVITATLVPEAEEVEDKEIEKEIREELEKITIPWVRGVLKVTISDYLFQD